jgi:hypothetical protein
MEAGAAFYLKQGNTYILKLVGDVRYTMGCALGDFLDQAVRKKADYDDIIVDLTERIPLTAPAWVCWPRSPTLIVSTSLIKPPCYRLTRCQSNPG